MSKLIRERSGPRLLGLALAVELMACDGRAELDDDIPGAPPGPAALEAQDGGRLRVRLAGDAPGEVAVVDTSTGDPIAICAETCTVQVPLGLQVELLAVTASTFAGWRGACAGAEPSCSFSMPPSAKATARFALVKVSGGDGSILWTVDLGSGGCSFASRMGHRFETSPNGDVAIKDGATLRVFSGAGDERWSSLVGGYCVVAVDSQGVIHVADEEPFSVEPTILHRFTADGEALPDTPRVAPQYEFAMAFDPADHLLASSAGHSHVDLLRWTPQLERVYQQTVDTFDPDSFENGVGAGLDGHAIWAYALTEEFPFEGFAARWGAPDGVVGLTLSRQPLSAGWSTFGAAATDLRHVDQHASPGRARGRPPSPLAAGAAMMRP